MLLTEAVPVASLHALVFLRAQCVGESGAYTAIIAKISQNSTTSGPTSRVEAALVSLKVPMTSLLLQWIDDKQMTSHLGFREKHTDLCGRVKNFYSPRAGEMKDSLQPFLENTICHTTK